MAALRIQVPDVPEPEWVPAAGVPWFVTLFGRDSLIVSHQTIGVYAPFARGALNSSPPTRPRSATTGATRSPGKISHELRAGRAGPLRADPAHPLLRHRGRHAALPDRAARGLEVDRRRGAAASSTWPPPSAACSGSTSTATSTATASRSTRPSRRRATRTGLEGRRRRRRLPGRQPGAAAQGALRAAGLRLRRQAADGRDLRCAGRDRPGRGATPPGGSARSALQRRLLVRGAGLLRLRRSTRTSSPSTPWPRTPGHCLWSGHRRPGQGRSRRRAAARARHVERLGHPHAVARRTRLQPVLLPAGLGLAARQRHHRAGFKRYGHAEEATRIAEAIFDAAARFESYRPAGALRRVDRPRPSSPSSTWARTFPRPGRRAASSCSSRRCSGCAPTRRTGRLYVNPTLPTWLPDVTALQPAGRRRATDPELLAPSNAPDAQTRWDVVDCTVAPIEVLAAPPGDESIDLAAGLTPAGLRGLYCENTVGAGQAAGSLGVKVTSKPSFSRPRTSRRSTRSRWRASK